MTDVHFHRLTKKNIEEILKLKNDKWWWMKGEGKISESENKSVLIEFLV